MNETYTFVNVKGDGNCFYRALASSLIQDDENLVRDNDIYDILRSLVCAFETDPKLTISNLPRRTQRQKLKTLYDTIYSTTPRDSKQCIKGTWAFQEDAFALAILLDTNMFFYTKVVSRDKKIEYRMEYFSGLDNTSFDDVHIVLITTHENPKEGHFNALIPKQGMPFVGTNVFSPYSVHTELTRLGFSLETAKDTGDCYLLSVIAGYDITIEQAADPDAKTEEIIKKLRSAAVDLIAGDSINGTDASEFRAQEGLATDPTEFVNSWREPGFWQVPENRRKEPPVFMFAVAATLKRPVVSLELLSENETGARNYCKTALVYADDFGNNLSRPQGVTGETIESYSTMPLTDALVMINKSPRAYSVVRLDRKAQHFDPFVYTHRRLSAAPMTKTEPHM